jgi:hypothetical protein
VKHVRIYPAYTRTLLIDPAPSFFQEVTRTIVVCPDRVARDIKGPGLITEFIIGGRHQCRFVQPADAFRIVIQQERVVVKFSRATFSTEVALESYILHDFQKSLPGISGESTELFV